MYIFLENDVDYKYTIKDVIAIVKYNFLNCSNQQFIIDSLLN